MNWTAVVPLRQGAQPKSRLAGTLSAEQRVALSRDMARRVILALAACAEVDRIVVLSPQALAEDLAVTWRPDGGRGMNAELDALRAELGDAAMLVIHGDLPLVGPEDIAALIAAAEQLGVALAPDRHGEGTNAIALAPGIAFSISFGEQSLARHIEYAPGAALVQRPGLMLDVDTPEDLDAAKEAGYISRPL